MTGSVQSRPRGAAAPTFGRLVNTEMRRFAARRFTKLLLALSVVGYLAAVLFLWTAHAQPSAADFERATVQRDQSIASIQEAVDQCLGQPGQTTDTCGFVPTPDQFPIDQFLQNDPFRPDMVQVYALAVGAAVAMAGFVLGATFIGAEWSSRNIVAWLYYEPRRLRLLGAKILVLCAVLLVLSVVAQVIWSLTAQLLLTNRGLGMAGLGDDADRFWSDTFAVQFRAAVLVLPAGLLGFGLANLIRNTAAALGIAFVYFVIVENIAAAISPGLQPYQFTVSVVAWIAEGGITVYGNPVYLQEVGSVVAEPIPVSNLQGGITLIIYTTVVVAVSVWMFRQRDIT